MRHQVRRAIFFEEDDARSAAAVLRGEGHATKVVRERLAGEDDDEDHPWAVLTDAPSYVLELLVDRHDGWVDAEDDEPGNEPGSEPGSEPGNESGNESGNDPPPPRPPPPPLPRAPRRLKRG